MTSRLLYAILLLCPRVLASQPNDARKAAGGFLTDDRFSFAEVSRVSGDLNSTDHDQVDGISPDGLTIFVSRTPVRQGNSDIYLAKRSGQGWGRPQRLGDDLNDSSNNFIGSAASDGELAFVRDGKIWIVENDTQYPADIDSFYTDAAYFSFALSPDAKLLVLALDREDSYGKTDLYLSYRIGGAHWSKPRNLGQRVNTRGIESGPMFSPEGTTIYFSSTGLTGYGGLDLFSAQFDPLTMRCSETRNLGAKINSEANEQFLVMDPIADRAYFTSDRAGTEGHDIFEARLQSDSGITMRGTVTDAITKRPIRARFEFDLQPSNIMVRTDSSNFDGSFFIDLPYVAKYEMRVTADGYFPVTEFVSLGRYEGERSVDRDLALQPLKAGAVVELKNINFESGTSNLSETSGPVLQSVVKLLKAYPRMRIQISGHTDNVGDANANKTLSLSRASAVVTYLVQAGIEQGRLEARGFGETQPITTNLTEAGREANRRVEFIILEE